MKITKCSSILIVEDDESIRGLLNHALETEGYTTVTARNGLEALTKLEDMKGKVLILLDMKMPFMSGLDVIEAITRNKMQDRVHIIVITASRIQRIEGIEVISKPCDLETVLSRVNEYCNSNYE